MVRDRWTDIEPLAAAHRYMQGAQAVKDPAELDKRRRRAGLAVLLSGDPDALARLAHGGDWRKLRARFEALLSYLEAGGCFFLRRGTIEDYYMTAPAPGLAGKPEAAAEAASFAEAGEEELQRGYTDVLHAVDSAAPEPPVAEEDFLRRLLAGLLATAFQTLTAATTNDDLAQLAASGDQSAVSVFKLEYATGSDGVRALRVRIVSSLFTRPSFPAVVTEDQNLHKEVAKLFQPLGSQPCIGGGAP